MKALYLIIIFIAPSVAFTQNVGLEKSSIYQRDPFTSYMMYEVDNPCKDYRYLSLRNISKNKISDKENTIFKQKSVSCQDFINKVKDSATDGLGTGKNNGDPRQIEVYTYYVVGGCALVLAVIFLVIK